MILLRLSGGDGDDGDNEDAVNGAEQLPSHGLLPSQAAANGPSRAAFLGANEASPEVHPGELPRRPDRAAGLSEVAGEAAGGGGDRRRKRQQRDESGSRRCRSQAEVVFFHLRQERSVIVAPRRKSLPPVFVFQISLIWEGNWTLYHHWDFATCNFHI